MSAAVRMGFWLALMSALSAGFLVPMAPPVCMSRLPKFGRETRALLAVPSGGGAEERTAKNTELTTKVEVEVVDEEAYEEFTKSRARMDKEREQAKVKQVTEGVSSGAGVAGAVIGGVVGGPLGAFALGMGATWMADYGEGRAANVTRKAGAYTRKVMNKAEEVNDTYNITKNVESGVKRGINALRKGIKDLNNDF